MSRLLVKAYEMGCRFDGWSEQFQYKQWQEAIEACGVDVEFYTTRARDLSEPLPWDHIDSGVSKEFLRREWEGALAGSQTPDCRDGECSLCGVCDLETVKPVTFEAETAIKIRRDPHRTSERPLFKKLQVSYAKRGPAKYFGHLELIKIFMRAFRRARIPLRFSEGFHPAPKVSFESALPVGIESTEERFLVEVPTHVQPASVVERVNEQLPDGLTITACTAVFQPSPVQKPKSFHYTITLKDGTFSERKLSDFLKSTTWLLTKTSQKGRLKTIDLKQAVTKLRLVPPNTAQMTLYVTPGHHVRPTEVLGQIFGLSESILKLATIIKGPQHADTDSHDQDVN
ncbi:MAG: DUF2344 domain-containing protein [Desulfobacterales bacterium]|nr:DUF2344 domain-containing protein [Desulfobacterales bacterium]